MASQDEGLLLEPGQCGNTGVEPGAQGPTISRGREETGRKGLCTRQSWVRESVWGRTAAWLSSWVYAQLGHGHARTAGLGAAALVWAWRAGSDTGS